MLLLADRFWPALGGAEVQSRRFLAAMRGRGYEFTVVTDLEDGRPETDETEEVDGVPVLRLPIRAAIDARDAAEILRLRGRCLRIRAELRPDLVHAIAYGRAVFFLRYLAGDAPVLLEVCIQFSEVAAREDSAIGRALRDATWVVANSASTLEQVRRLVPAVRARSSFVYPGLPVAPEPPKPLQLEPPRLLCFGRLAAEKGFDVAVLAFPQVLRRFPQAQLRFAGDGPLREGLERLADARGIAAAVRFTGWADPAAIPALIDDASLVWMPSRWEEAFGLVAAETALRARPIVATRVGGLKEVVLDGKTGILVDRDDPDALARVTVELLEQPQKAARLGEAARERATRLFSVERYADEFDALYARCTSASRQPSLP